MNGDISRIPIQSLGAVVSLTDILPELPLPAPLRAGSSSDVLVEDSQVAESAANLLKEQSSHLTSLLGDALESACTNSIEFKDGYAHDSVDLDLLPNYLVNVLIRNQAVFQNKRGFFSLSSFTCTPISAPSTSCDTWRQLKVNTIDSAQDLRTPVSSVVLNGSPIKKRKKHKKKSKHRHRDANCVSEGTSETGGESNSTTPATYDEVTPARRFDDDGSSPTPTYGVVADTKKLSLKIFKRPVIETALQSHLVGDASSVVDHPKKEKKKKKHKDRDRDRKSKRQRHPSSSQTVTSALVCNAANGEPSVNTIPVCTTILNSCIPTDQLPSDNFPNAVIPSSADTCVQPNFEASQCVNSLSDVNFAGGDGLFEPLGSTHIPYRQPPSQSTSSLPSTPASTGVVRSNKTTAVLLSEASLPTDLSNHGFVSQSSLFDGILNEVEASFMNSSSLPTSDLLSVSCGTVSAPPACMANSVCNMMDYASHYLQNEMLSAVSLCDGFSMLGASSASQVEDTVCSRPSSVALHSPHSFNSSFMISSQLNDSISAPSTMPTAANEPDFSPTSMLNSSHFVTGSGASPSSVFGHNFDLAAMAIEPVGHHHIPMGLASYLTGPGLTPTQNSHPQARQVNLRNEPPLASLVPPTSQPSWKRKPKGPMRRRRRRKNELEDLQQWTVNYPTSEKGALAAAAAERAGERTWDDAIGSYSQVLGERAKRRKRMARQTGNFDPAYVFEHDKDYHDEGESDTNPDGAVAVDLTNGPDNDASQMSSSNFTRCLRETAVHRSYAGMDEDEEDDVNSGVAAGGENHVGSRRKRKADDDEPFEVRLKEPVEARFPHLIRKSSETIRKRRERVGFGFGPETKSTKRVLPELTFGAEAGSLKRFLQRLQSVLDSMEDCETLRDASSTSCSVDVNRQDPKDVPDVSSRLGSTDVADVPSEAFIGPEELAELCRDTAKLNATHITNQIPLDLLVKFITLLLINIRDGASVIATLRPDEEADEHENRLWRELAMERVMRSVHAGLTGLLLMTSVDMPREVYVEDIIDRTIQTVRFQLFNCIYPEFDPAYRVENTAKENQSSIKSRRARERDVHKPRAIIQLYHKLVEIVTNLAKLVRMQRLTDSLVLALSSMGVSVFFVENVSELQLAALDLVTAVFAHYEPHRKLIMEEILASLARLPSSKRNLRSYRLNTEDSIQMLTALSLLLVQSVIALPTLPDAKNAPSALPVTQGDSAINAATEINASMNQLADRTDDEVVVITSYHNALRTAHTFLLVFLRKSTVKGEDDYRLIFENFVNDLLLAVNKPEWPAAEVMLSLLGSLLVQQFNNKSLDQSVRVASVDYLGTVASTLRRDAVTSQLKENDIDAVIRDLLDGSRSDTEDEDDDVEPSSVQKIKESEEVAEDKKVKEEDSSLKSANDSESTKQAKDPEENGFLSSSPLSVDDVNVKNVIPNKADSKRNKRKSNKQVETLDPLTQLDRVQALRDAILDYLAAEEANPTSVYARKFYLAQWLSDCTKETERAQRSASDEGLLNGNGELRNRKSKLSIKQQETVLTVAEQRREHILFKIREPPDTWRQRKQIWTSSMLRTSSAVGRRENKLKGDSSTVSLVFHGTLDYEDAYLVCRFLASLRPFSQSFDVYLSQICKLLSESSVPVRTKALRCLSAVVEADPNVLARVDIERAVHARLLDTSTSVREAAVDLLGRFLGRKPELTAQYYPMLAERIRDKGVSVRKRVIRIMRDICLEQPDFPRIAEICVKMIRRVNDEEGIKKLVNEVFQTMWFTPVRDKETVRLLRKVMNITDVVAACKDTGYEWFEQFLRSLLKKEETEKVKPVEKACKQIVDCLVQYIMRLEEISGQNNQRFVACLATLHLLTKIRPELMVQYAMVLQTYLRCNETSDPHVLHYVARILEVTVPLMEHPSETFVAQLEEDMVRLTLRHGKMVLESCVACLGSVVNRVSKNYSLPRDCFTRFFNALQRFRTDLADDPEQKISPTVRPSILRALFTVGLLCKHFDPNVFQSNININVRDQVFEILMFFTEQVQSDLEMRKKALTGLGFLCTRHHELLCGPKLREFYQHLLQADSISAPSANTEDPRTKVTSDHLLELKCIVLENLLNFFLEEEKRMLEADAKWKVRQHQESLKEMGDIASSTGSSVAQTYLKDTLETFFSAYASVRLTSLSVVSTILRQGLIHPVQTVPYLIAMQTDLDATVRVKADAQLQEIDHKFPGFLSMRSIQGVGLSYRLQFILYPEILQTVSQKTKPTPVSNSDPVMSPDGSTTNFKSDPAPPTRRSTRNKNCTATSDVETGMCSFPTSQEESVNPAKNLDDSSDQTNSTTENIGGLFDCIRGTRDPINEVPSALNSNLYSMLRGNRGQRRSLLSGLIALFDDSQSQRCHLSQLVYIADNLAHFPYQCQEEPLFVIHHIDLMVSMSGSGVLQNVRETLFPELKAALEAALAAQAEVELKSRTQTEIQLRAELQSLHNASADALARSDHSMVECHAEQIQATMQKLDVIAAITPTALTSCTSTMSELRSAALVGRDCVPHIDLGPLEEEENADALLNRLDAARATALPLMRDAIRSSRICVLLLTLKQFLKEVYSITDPKIQRYSPTDSPKLWERPLTRRAGVKFHPAPCIQAASVELHKLMESTSSHNMKHQEWPIYPDTSEDSLGEECYAGEMRSLVQNFLEFRKLILTIDPPGEDDIIGAEDLNTSTQSTSLPNPPATNEQPTPQVPAVPLCATRLRSARTLVPQSHNKSSEEENDSDDSNAGGASRLMLAQSAPNRRRKPGMNLRSSATTRSAVTRSTKKKRRKKRRSIVHGSSSGEESESVEESEQSDPDY